MYSIGRSRLRALLLSDSGGSTHAQLYTIIYMPRARHACTETVLGITARCVTVSVAVWEYGPGSVCVGLRRPDTPEGEYTPELTTRPCLSPA